MDASTQDKTLAHMALLEQELQDAHEELQNTNSELLQLTLEMDDRIARRTRELEEANQLLVKEIEVRKKAQADLQEHQSKLEGLVARRTADLELANTELKSNVIELAASEERFKSLVFTIPDIIYQIDTRGMFTFLNDAVRRLGYAPRDLIGKHFSKLIHPDDLDSICREKVLVEYSEKIIGDENAPKLFDERRTGSRKTTNLEVRLAINLQDGKQPGFLQAIGNSYIITEVNSSGMYEINPQTKHKVFIGTVGVIRDISDRKEMEQALINSESRLKAILNSTEAGIMMVDAETREICEANPAAMRLMAAKPDAVIGTVCHQFICPTEQGNCPVLDLEQTVDSSERTLISSCGEVIPILKTVTPLRLNDHQYLLESFVDISNLKQVEEELKQSHDQLEKKVAERTAELARNNEMLLDEIAERKRAEAHQRRLMQELKRSQMQLIQAEKLSTAGTLVAGVAHELNNPMMAMIHFCEYCLRNTDENDRRYPVLKDMIKETERCADIVNNLLTFSRQEKDHQNGYRQENIREIVQRVLRLLSYRIEKEHVSVVQQYAHQLPTLYMKPSGIQQVFLNLISNAIDALSECNPKEIHISATRSQSLLQVLVSDTGPGIPQNVINRIFDPFFSSKPVGKGTGLGLSVSRSIIEVHGGQLTCENRNESGAAFLVSLPLDRRKERHA